MREKLVRRRGHQLLPRQRSYPHPHPPMLQSNDLPLPFSFNQALNSCSSLSALRNLHCRAISLGLLSFSLRLATKFLLCAARVSRNPLYARQMFDAMPQRDSQSWNSILRVYSDLGPCEETLILFLQMRREGIPPDCFTFPPAVRSCGVVSDLVAGKQLHCDALKWGLSQKVHLQSALLAMYAQNWEVGEAERVFQETEIKNLVSWTAMVAAYVQNGDHSLAAEAFRKMLAAGLQPNDITLACILPVMDCAAEFHGFVIKSGFGNFINVENSLISAYGRCGRLASAEQLFNGMRLRTTATWNALIGAYERNGEEKRAIELFERMIEEDVDFDHITLVSAVSASTALADLEKGRILHEIAKNSGLLLNFSVSNALVNMYAKCGSLEVAREVFNEMPVRDVVSWTSIISAYAAHGRGEEALGLFERMKAVGSSPNASTFIAILAACSHAGLVSEGRNVFESMERDFSLRASDEHVTCVVDLLSRGGRLREAYEFIDERAGRVCGDAWVAFMGGCRVHGNVAVAEMAAERMFQEEPGCAAGYVILARIYAEAGRWDDADRLRKRMKCMMLKKEPALSMVRA